MSQPDSQSDYVTCACQHCDGHIKFGADQLRKGESKRIECPHCHLETIIFHPHTGGKDSRTAEKTNLARAESSDRKTNGKQPKSTRTELFIFALVRFVTLTGAVLALIAFFVVADLAFQTLLPEKPEQPPKIVPISYESVAPVQQTAQVQPNEKAFVPIGAKMAGKNKFPQPVVDFLLAHEGFSLKEWLDQLKPENQQPFLDNLALILQTAKSKHLTPQQSEQVVRDFAELWIAINQKPPDPNAALEKQNAALEKKIYRASCISAAFGLFITLTSFCLILVLLAIERNTRNEKRTAQQ